MPDLRAPVQSLPGHSETSWNGSWLISGGGGPCSEDGDHRPTPDLVASGARPTSSAPLQTWGRDCGTLRGIRRRGPHECNSVGCRAALDDVLNVSHQTAGRMTETERKWGLLADSRRTAIFRDA